jgi:sulfofructose kinase
VTLDSQPLRSRASPDVIGLGFCVYDILAIAPGMPQFDDLEAGHAADLVWDGGGPVGTALAALGRLGARTGYVGLLGDDPQGRWLRELFKQEGVDVARLRLESGVGTNVCLIVVEEGTGRRAFLCHQRVGAQDLVLDEADRATIQAARVLHLDGQFMPAAIQAARWMREAGGRVCYDGNHPRPGLEELLPLVNWLVVAESFPVRYSGLDNPEAAVASLMELGPEVVVVTLGEQGCRVWWHGQRSAAAGAVPDPEGFSKASGSMTIPAFPVEVVDTTGAGDAFHGGFIYGMLQGWDLHRVAEFANAVASLNCQTLGGRRGLPSLAQVEEFLAAWQAG